MEAQPLDRAWTRGRTSLAARVHRLHDKSWQVTQCAVSAGVAWFIAADLLGHDTPFFAPIAAVLSLGTSYGQRLRRVVEVAIAEGATTINLPDTVGYALPAEYAAMFCSVRERVPGADGVTVIAGHRDTLFRALATLEVGDELALERPDGSVLRYEVAALDVVDSARAELRLDADESIVVLVTCWPFEAVEVGGRWRYVVTAHQRF